ncbi:MAG: hypothetical protein ACK5IA_05460, partial [Cyanobacteriota bacterium]
LLLVLGSLSLQTLSLQGRLRTVAQLRLRQAEDGLASGAQQLVGDLNQHHPCLLTLPRRAWGDPQGRAWAEALRPAALRRFSVLGQSVELVGGQPSGSGVALQLASAAAAGQPARRAAFAVQLAGTPLQAQLLRELGLRGGQP